MIYTARDLARVRNPVLLVSAVMWILILAEPGGMGTIAHCPVMSSGAMPSLRMLLHMNPPGTLAAGWALMLGAMMSPVLIPPLYYIRLRSFTHRRARSSVIFVAGYAIVWMAFGGVLLATELSVRVIAPQSLLPAAVVFLLAVVWQFSPVKQRCLNRCHSHNELAAFGAAADWHALRFGLTHGIWCAGSCWALMLFPMLLSQGHTAAMAAVTVLICSERLEQSTPPSWRVRGFGAVTRIAAARSRLPLRLLR